jgi:acetyl-CoA C-acetyltransferase
MTPAAMRGAGIPDSVPAMSINKLCGSGLKAIMLAAGSIPLVPLEKLNPNGGAVALGHPVGASGGRLVATTVRELHRRGLRYGVAALCIGGGEAVAAVFERV